MGFENASITWGAKQLAAMVKNERIVFGNIIQRSYVWEKARKSLFIHSLAIGVPIPPTYAKRFDDGSDKRNSNVYDMLDGKQRFSTVAEFINNELVLTELPPVTFYNELTDEQETEVNIQLRNSALADSFAEFFKVDGSEDSETLIPDEEDVQE